MAGWAEAFLWGLVVGSGLIIGAVVGYFKNLSHRVISAVMGFGAGVLIAVLSFELVEEAYLHGGMIPVIAGFTAGAVLFSIINRILSAQGARHRKRCSMCVEELGNHQPGGSDLAIAAGSVIDGIPEALIVGITLSGGVAIAKPVLIGFFLANIPEAISSASGMKASGRSKGYVFRLWAGITLLTGFASLVGYSVLGGLSDTMIAFTTSLAAGGILAMLAETMIPEAVEKALSFTGVITAAGFLFFFLVIKISKAVF